MLAGRIADSVSINAVSLSSARTMKRSVVAMRVSNPACLPFAIYRRNTAPTPTGLAEIVAARRTDVFTLLL
jgi:hypothetical protein